jgi:hypothetical protein
VSVAGFSPYPLFLICALSQKRHPAVACNKIPNYKSYTGIMLPKTGNGQSHKKQEWERRCAVSIFFYHAITQLLNYFHRLYNYTLRLLTRSTNDTGG